MGTLLPPRPVACPLPQTTQIGALYPAASSVGAPQLFMLQHLSWALGTVSWHLSLGPLSTSPERMVV